MDRGQTPGSALTRRCAICIAVATLLFSSMEIALKTISASFNALELNFLRFAIGGLFLTPFAFRSIKRRGRCLQRRDWGFFALAGLTCVVASIGLYQLALQYCRASIVAVIFSCNPVFVIPLAAVFLKEKIRSFTILSMLLSLGGMVAIMNPGTLAARGAPGRTEILGIALTIGSAFLFAVYGVMGRSRSARLGGLATTAFSFLFGSAELLVLILASRVPFIAASLRGAGLGSFADIPLASGLSLHSLPVFLYVSLGVTGLGYAAYFTAIEESSASAASVVFFIKPALAPVLAMVLLGESIAANTAAGIGLIIAGSAISFIGGFASDKSRRRTSSENTPSD